MVVLDGCGDHGGSSGVDEGTMGGCLGWVKFCNVFVQKQNLKYFIYYFSNSLPLSCVIDTLEGCNKFLEHDIIWVQLPLFGV